MVFFWGSTFEEAIEIQASFPFFLSFLHRAPTWLIITFLNSSRKDSTFSSFDTRLKTLQKKKGRAEAKKALFRLSTWDTKTSRVSEETQKMSIKRTHVRASAPPAKRHRGARADRPEAACKGSASKWCLLLMTSLFAAAQAEPLQGKIWRVGLEQPPWRPQLTIFSNLTPQSQSFLHVQSVQVNFPLAVV
jgi:hypothetical protein